jgi:DNA-binding XRE family transcriptional regulator
MEILRTMRERAGLTVVQAAERIGVRRSTIYAWEGGAKIPTAPNLRTAMDAYGASAEERDRVARARAFGDGSSMCGEQRADA